MRYMDNDRLNKSIDDLANTNFRGHKICKNANYRLHQQFEKCNIGNWYSNTNVHNLSVITVIENKLLNEFNRKWNGNINRDTYVGQ